MTVKAHCEDCQELAIITPTGKKQGSKGTSEHWRILEHKNQKTGQWCPGSGRLV